MPCLKIVTEKRNNTAPIITFSLTRERKTASEERKTLSITDAEIMERKETWTKEDLQFLKENYSKMKSGEIAQKLNRSLVVVSEKAKRENMVKPVTTKPTKPIDEKETKFK